MRRREFLRVGLCVLTALTALPSTLAREPGTSVRIGWLSAGKKEDYRPLVEAFRQGMSELGHVEGKSYVIDFHWGADTPKSLDAMASEMMQNHPDIVLATCQFTSRAALNAAPDVPVVVAGGANLVSVGLARSLSRPGGNITGLTSLSPEIAAKRLELLKEVVPRAARIAVLNEADDANSRQALAALQPAALALHIDLLTYDASRTSDYAKIFDDMRTARADAFLMVSAPNIVFSERRALADLALRSHLPSSFPTYEFVEAGGMMSLGVDFRVLFRRSATYVDKILKGANAGELPIEQPTSFELAVNQKTARALGVAIPQSVLVRADRIIE